MLIHTKNKCLFYEAVLRTLVASLALVGMRNIRDFKAQIRPDSDTLGSASPFNIVTEALTIKNFTKDLGLILETEGSIMPSNPIYAEVIIRALSANSQKDLGESRYPYRMGG